jgi:hypothetical protein
LVVRAGTESALQVLGTDNTAAEGDVFMYKSATVSGSLFVGSGISTGGSLTVSGVDVLSELANKQGTLRSSSTVSVSRITATTEVVTDIIRASTASELTCADNLAVTGGLTADGLDLVQGTTNAEPAFEVESPLEKD